MARDAVLAARRRGVDFTPYDVLDERHRHRAVRHPRRPWRRADRRPRTTCGASSGSSPAACRSARTCRAHLPDRPRGLRVGVCAHEWGHLAARWADYYDTGQSATRSVNGLGNYCLMAAGSWGNGGLTPGLPNAMLRMFHGWIDATAGDKTTRDIG